MILKDLVEIGLKEYRLVLLIGRFPLKDRQRIVMVILVSTNKVVAKAKVVVVEAVEAAEVVSEGEISLRLCQ